MGERTVGRPVAAISPVQQMLASGTGALLTSLFVTPLDVIKIRLQSQQTPFHQGKKETVLMLLLFHCFAPKTNPATHLSLSCPAFCLHPSLCSVLHLHVCVYRVMAVPATIIYFTCYDQLRDFMWFGLGFQGSHIPLLAGGLARLGAVTVISPLELVRTKMQSRKLTYKQLWVCIHSAVAQDGLLSLWRGWGPTVLRDVPFSALYWFNYELVKTKLCEEYQMPQANFSISFSAGAVSGAIAAVLTLPFDVVKTRRQIQLGEIDALAVSLKKTTSTWHIMKNIWAELGYRGLFAGFMPRVIKVAPACAVMISSYEFGKAFFQKMNLDRQQLAT
uniref:Mitochondrial glutathione transporter SLC25A39 n=1 Tax=Nothobranchius furzeri TaxID=105023 RepID=A0A8C6PLF6_NOTFU